MQPFLYTKPGKHTPDVHRVNEHRETGRISVKDIPNSDIDLTSDHVKCCETGFGFEIHSLHKTPLRVTRKCMCDEHVNITFSLLSY